MTSYCLQTTVCVLLALAMPHIGEAADEDKPAAKVNGSDMGSVFEHLAACFPSQQSREACSEMYESQGEDIQTCSWAIAEQITLSRRGGFVKRWAEFRFRRQSSSCEQKHCSEKLKQIGDLLRKSAFEKNNTDLICKDNNGRDLYDKVQSVKADCFQIDAVKFYQTLLFVLCTGSRTDINYLFEMIRCYPPGLIEFGEQGVRAMCGDVHTSIARTKTISSRGCSQTAVILGQHLLARYASKCDPPVSCSTELAECFEGLFVNSESSSSEPFNEKHVCASVSDLKICFGKTLCEKDDYKELLEYFDEACATV